MNFVSLFAGIGGFDLGFERNGMNCVAQVERDKSASGILARHFSHAERFGDVRDVGRRNLPAVDLICGGFPCQDLSVAGRRAGLAGERSGLWFEFRRILEETQPRFCVIENVPGLLSSNGGADLAVVFQGLVECGYRVAYRVLDAQYFGVAQRRRRVFIVGSLGNGSSAQVLFEREGSTGDFETSRAQGQTVARNAVVGTLSSSGAGTARTGNSRSEADMLVQAYRMQRSDAYEPATVDATVAARDYKSATDLVAIDLQQVTSAVNRSRPSTVASTLSQSSDVITYAVDQELNGRRELMGALQFSSANGGGKPAVVANRSVGVRRLTPRECESLQGFPRDWTAGQPDSTRYRQLGNAVCVNVAAWLGKRIAEAVAASTGSEAA